MNKLANFAAMLVATSIPFNFYKIEDDFEFRIYDAFENYIAYVIWDKNGNILETSGTEGTILEDMLENL